jgi:hypothetical protein
MELNYRKHNLYEDETRMYTHCSICGQTIGQGYWTLYPCTERFNNEQFQEWLKWKNYSKVDEKSRMIHYVRRFSDKVYTIVEVLKEYKKSIEESQKHK